MKLERKDEKYILELEDIDLVVLVSSLSMFDSLVTSDAAFVDYAGTSRQDFRDMVKLIADSYRSLQG